MPTATAAVTELSPRGGDSHLAPPGKTFALLFRKHRGEPWVELLRHKSAEQLWLASLEFRLNGAYREVMVTEGLFDQQGELG